MGAALLAKPALGTRFSILVFGVSQVAIDIEPLVRIMRRDSVLHGWTHTLAGALVIGAGAALGARPAVNAWLRVVRRGEGDQPRDGALLRGVSWRVAFSSAWLGTFSHLALDGIMHGDMHPFAPLTDQNPLLGVISLRALHLGLVLAGVTGLALLAVTGTARDGE